MAKKKVSLQRTGAFALAMTTALSTLSFSAANAAQSSHDTFKNSKKYVKICIKYSFALATPRTTT